MSEGTKWKILAGLVLVWVVIVSQRMVTESEPQRVPLRYTSGQTTTETAVTGASRPTLVARAPMVAKAVGPAGKPSKNIFAPLEFPKPKKKKAKKVKPPPARATPASPPGPSLEELAAAQARKQMAQYRFLGYVTQGDEPRAFLVKGREIFIMRTGETLDHNILVASIEPTAVTLRETRTNLAATLPLTKGDGGLFMIDQPVFR